MRGVINFTNCSLRSQVKLAYEISLGSSIINNHLVFNHLYDFGPWEFKCFFRSFNCIGGDHYHFFYWFPVAEYQKININSKIKSCPCDGFLI